MYELSRVRLYSIGPAGARYADTVLDLRGVGEPVPDPAPTQAEFFEDEPVGPPRRPAPAGVLFLENGGGKSVLLKLIFSVMLPGHRNTLGGASSGVLRKFLLADDCGHVALEWQHTLTGECVVVGKVERVAGAAGLQRSAEVRRGLVLLPARARAEPGQPAGRRVHRRTAVRRGRLGCAGAAAHHEGLPGRDHRGGQGVSAPRSALGGDPRPLDRAPRRPGSRPRTLPLPAGDERRRGRGRRPLRRQEGLRLHRPAAARGHRHPGHRRARRPGRRLRQQAGAAGRADRRTGLHRRVRRPARADRRGRGSAVPRAGHPRGRRAAYAHTGPAAVRARRPGARPGRRSRPAGHRRRVRRHPLRGRAGAQRADRRRTRLPARLVGTRGGGEDGRRAEARARRRAHHALRLAGRRGRAASPRRRRPLRARGRRDPRGRAGRRPRARRARQGRRRPRTGAALGGGRRRDARQRGGGAVRRPPGGRRGRAPGLDRRRHRGTARPQRGRASEAAAQRGRAGDRRGGTRGMARRQRSRRGSRAGRARRQRRREDGRRGMGHRP
jgi:hypothetical protein